MALGTSIKVEFGTAPNGTNALSQLEPRMASNAFLLPILEAAWSKLGAGSLGCEEVSLIALNAAVFVCSLAERDLWTQIAIVVNQPEVCLAACTLSVAVITGTSWNWDYTDSIPNSKVFLTNEAFAALFQDTAVDLVSVAVRVRRIQTPAALEARTVARVGRAAVLVCSWVGQAPPLRQLESIFTGLASIVC